MGCGWARENSLPLAPNHLSAQFYLMPYQLLGSQPSLLPMGLSLGLDLLCCGTIQMDS